MLNHNDVATATAGAKTTPPAQPILEVDNLRTHFFTADGVVPAVDGVSYSVNPGETLGVVGESGCGKSVTALSILRLVADPPGRIVGGAIRFQGTNLLDLTEPEMERIRGNDISMIFQEPMTSLNPLQTAGQQISEAIALHQDLARRAAMDGAIDMLRRVHIPEPERRAQAYPHKTRRNIPGSPSRTCPFLRKKKGRIPKKNKKKLLVYLKINKKPTQNPTKHTWKSKPSSRGRRKAGFLKKKHLLISLFKNKQKNNPKTKRNIPGSPSRVPEEERPDS